ncbi:MAG: Hpt domain-containing protein, partial [Dehalococcoidia bacterium]|nr:Hpt domain-containing protein [Dehalococcoidia bacterium]
MAFINDDETLQAFKEESHEHLDGIESDLLAIEEAGAEIDQELVNKVFRAMHSIKGGASFLGLNAIKTLAHAAEDLLNKIRNKQLVPTAPVISSLLDAADLVNRLLNQPKGAVEFDISGPLSALNKILSPSAAPEPSTSPAPPTTTKPVAPAQTSPWQELLQEHSAEISDSRLGGETVFVLEYDLVSDVEPQGLTANLDTLGSIGQVLGVLRVDDSLPAYVLFSTMMDKEMLVSFAGLPMERVHEIKELEEPASVSVTPLIELLSQPTQAAEETPPPSSSTVAAKKTVATD